MITLPRILSIISTFGILWLFIEVGSYFKIGIIENFSLSGGWGYTILILLSLVITLAYLLFEKHARESVESVESVRFWNTVVERQAIGIDVRGLLSKSKTQVFLSGITMHYVITSCKEELREVLRKGVRVDIVTAIDDDSKVFYKRYCNINLITESHKSYRLFFDELSKRERGLLKVYASRTTITHSIGKYDEEIFVSEFCIDTDSLHVPSYRLTPIDQAYTIIDNEIILLKNESMCLFGATT